MFSLNKLGGVLRDEFYSYICKLQFTIIYNYSIYIFRREYIHTHMSLFIKRKREKESKKERKRERERERERKREREREGKTERVY